MPGSTPFRRAPTGLPPHPPQAGLHSSHVAGAGVGPLHLTPDEEERVAAHVERVWKGATGLTEVPPLDMLATLVGITLRKSREVAAERDDLSSQGM